MISKLWRAIKGINDEMVRIKDTQSSKEKKKIMGSFDLLNSVVFKIPIPDFYVENTFYFTFEDFSGSERPETEMKIKIKSINRAVIEAKFETLKNDVSEDIKFCLYRLSHPRSDHFVYLALARVDPTSGFLIINNIIRSSFTVITSENVETMRSPLFARLYNENAGNPEPPVRIDQTKDNEVLILNDF